MHDKTTPKSKLTPRAGLLLPPRARPAILYPRPRPRPLPVNIDADWFEDCGCIEGPSQHATISNAKKQLRIKNYARGGADGGELWVPRQHGCGECEPTGRGCVGGIWRWR